MGQQCAQGEAAVFKACVAAAKSWGSKHTAALALVGVAVAAKRPTACPAAVAVGSCHAAMNAELASIC